MQSAIVNPQSEPAWEKLAPVLDEAMSRLGEKERNAVVLKFFEGRTIPEVAAALAVNESAAKKRVSRALDKMRKFFARRGLVVSAAILGASLGENSVQAAPAGAAATVAAMAAAKGAAAGLSTLALVKSTLNLMAWAKLKLAALLGGAALLAVGAPVVFIAQADPFRGARTRFEVKGIVLYDTSAENAFTNSDVTTDPGRYPTVRTMPFKVTVDGGRWCIETRDSLPGGGYVTQLTIYNGKESFRVETPDKEARQKALSQLASPNAATFLPAAEVTVQSSPVPAFGIMDIGKVVWFAYASGDYLNKTPPNLRPALLPGSRQELQELLAAIPYGGIRSSAGFETDIARRVAVPHLPETAVVLDSGAEQPAASSHGLTNLIFQALAFTNLAGMEIPLRFKLSVYHRPAHGTSDSDGLQLAFGAEGWLTNLSHRISTDRFKPEFPGTRLRSVVAAVASVFGIKSGSPRARHGS